MVETRWRQELLSDQEFRPFSGVYPLSSYGVAQHNIAWNQQILDRRNR